MKRDFNDSDPQPPAPGPDFLSPFRAHVVNRDRSHGTISLRLSSREIYVELLIGLAIAGGIAMLVFGRYEASVSVRATARASAGMLKLTANQSGVVTKVSAREGDQLLKNQEILTIESSKSGGYGEESELATLQQLYREKEAIAKKEQDAELAKLQYDLKKSATAEGSAVLALQRSQEARDLQLQRVRIAGEALDAARALLEQGLITKSLLFDREADLLTQRRALLTIDAEIADFRRSSSEQAIEKQRLFEQLAAQKAAHQRLALDLRASEANDQFSRRQRVAATEQGNLVALFVEAGQSVSQGQVVAQVQPDSDLYVEALVPSGSTGLVCEGQSVQVRPLRTGAQVDFQVPGKVTHVSKVVLRGTAFDQDTVQPSAATATDSVFRVKVRLQPVKPSEIRALSAIRPGSQLEALIQTGARPVYDFLVPSLLRQDNSNLCK